MRKKTTAILLILCLLFTFAVTPFASAQTKEPKTQLTSLTTNYQKNPIGIESDQIRFGWNMQSNLIGQAQKEYQISLKKGSNQGEEIWNSGTVQSARSTAIPYTGPALELETRYTWTVTVTDALGQQVSETAFFETGCDWGDTSWITIQDYDNEMNSLLFRTEQSLSGEKIISARLYITGLGDYEAYLNGREVQGERNSILTPGWTDYSSYIHYQTYDVTDYLAQGDQTVTLGAIVGTGWYGSSIVDPKAIGYDKAIGEAELLERCLYAKMVITYADGSSQVIATDADNWKVSDFSPVEKDGIYEGERYNAETAAQIDGWNNAGYDVSSWVSPAELTYGGIVKASADSVIYDYQELPMESAYSYNADDVVTAEQGSAYAQGELDPNKITSYQAGDEISLKAGDTLLVDFGQNAAATVSFALTAPAGTALSMQPGECLSDGKDGEFVKGTLIPGACAGRGFSYVASGNGIETYLSQFHFTGYQYLEITANQDVTFHSLTSVAVSSVGEETGFVETSNDLLNQFVSNSKWSQISNFNSVPTDCPQREYYGWSGDAQLFAESGMYHFDSARVLSNYTEIMNDFANTYGNYANIMPMHTNSFFSKLIGAGWADAGVIIPWVYYQQTGDLSLAKTYWSEMTKYTDTVYSRGHTYSLGDWMGIGESSGTPFTANVYNILIQELMSKMADGLGYEADAVKYAQNAENKRQVTIEKYVTEQGDVLSATADGGGDGFVDNAQTALAWCIKLKLYNTEQQRQGIIANLEASVKNENHSISENRGENTLSTGFLGVNVLLPALSEGGMSDTAYDLMLNTDLYTFLYSVAHGATTIWESWDIWTQENGYDTSNISQNHYSYGAASEWLYEYLLGIQKDEETPGFQHFILQPEANSALTDADGSYNSYYGEIKSGWSIQNGETNYRFTVPANTSATLYLPAEQQTADGFHNIDGVTYMGTAEHNGNNCAVFELQAGGYDFVVSGNAIRASHQEGYLTVASADKGILRTVLAYAEKQYADSSFDTVITDVQASFTASLEAAREVDADLNASQTDVDAAWQSLMTEIHKLGFVQGDKESLAQLIQVAQSYADQIDRYTPATAQPFVAALDAAQVAFEDGNAIQADVDAASQNLLDAMMNLRYRADKSILQAVLAQANQLDLSAYDTEATAVFNSAKVAAEAVYSDADAEQDAVDAAVANLKKAIEALKTSVDGEKPVAGDSNLTTGSGNAKTGETFPTAAAIAVLLLAGTAAVVLKKRSC